MSQSGDIAPYDISCYNYSDGWAQSDPTGGVPATAGYNYNWVTAGSSISTNYYIENLSAGNNYTVTITDANGCTVSESTGIHMIWLIRFKCITVINPWVIGEIL